MLQYIPIVHLMFHVYGGIHLSLKVSLPFESESPVRANLNFPIISFLGNFGITMIRGQLRSDMPWESPTSLYKLLYTLDGYLCHYFSSFEELMISCWLHSIDWCLHNIDHLNANYQINTLKKPYGSSRIIFRQRYLFRHGLTGRGASPCLATVSYTQAHTKDKMEISGASHAHII